MTAHSSGHERILVPGGRFGSAGAVTLTVSPAWSFSVPSLWGWEVLNDQCPALATSAACPYLVRILNMHISDNSNDYTLT